jgi:hypothetical protein
MAVLPPEVILFEHANFRGAHRHVFQRENDLAATAGGVTGAEPADGKFDGVTSSIVVVRGTWEFFEEKNCTGHSETLGQGAYPDVRDHEIKNDKIASLKPA